MYARDHSEDGKALSMHILLAGCTAYQCDLEENWDEF